MDKEKKRKALVTGAGGFIGHHLVSYLKKRDYWVRGVDIKVPAYEISKADEFQILDLREEKNAFEAVNGVEEVFALAADMGGMGYIQTHHLDILMNSSPIDFNTIKASLELKVQRFFYASSACVYNEELQENPDNPGLKEEDAWPAQPQDAYGLEKLYTEEILRYAGREKPLKTRIARFHNVYGPLGTWQGGREKAPAAACRKIALAKITGNPEVEIWGDGQTTRSFCYVDDCVEGIDRLMQSEYPGPVNIGSDFMVTVDQLYDIIAEIAGISIIKKHIPGPQGVRGRNSDNTLIKNVLGWEPSTPLREGLSSTYGWIFQQLQECYQK